MKAMGCTRRRGMPPLQGWEFKVFSLESEDRESEVGSREAGVGSRETGVSAGVTYLGFAADGGHIFYRYSLFII